MILRYNYVLLLVGLLCLIIADPLTQTVPALADSPVLELAALATVLFGIWSLIRRPAYFVAGWVMVLVATGLNGAGYFYDLDQARLAMFGVIAVFLALIAGIVLRDILFAASVSLNRLVGATCVYLLIGLIFAIGYVYLDMLVPGSFEGFDVGDGRTQFRELTYHSFVTLTTVGYGDVIPVLPLARTMSYIEAIVGQMYLAILVASLVGLHLAARHDRSS